MSCSGTFLGLRWDHHKWTRRVTSAETVPTRETTMWGGVVNTSYVRCHTEYVCRECGTTRDGGVCVCDTARGASCTARLAWVGSAGRHEN
jgi:hypothetical protein